MGEDAWQALWDKERKKSQRRRWLTISGFAFVIVAYISAPYLAAYFLVDASAPIVSGLLEQNIVNKEFSRRYAFSGPSSAKLLVGELQKRNIPYELMQSYSGLHVVKVSSYDIEQVDKIIGSKGMVPVVTDISLKIDTDITNLRVGTSEKY